MPSAERFSRRGSELRRSPLEIAPNKTFYPFIQTTLPRELHIDDIDEHIPVMYKPIRFRNIPGSIGVVRLTEVTSDMEKPLGPVTVITRYSTDTVFTQAPLGLHLSFDIDNSLKTLSPDILSREERYLDLDKYLAKCKIGKKTYYLQCGGEENFRNMHEVIKTDPVVWVEDFVPDVETNGKFKRTQVVLPYSARILAGISVEFVERGPSAIPNDLANL
ncbi:MAG TPA: hypothetical protein VE090_02635 [Methylomirabilota bacterium]|nr:hypothetical protein [Methylomirabilota bacterium]